MNDYEAKSALNEALIDLGMVKGKEHGMYAPLVRRCPLYVDEVVPVRIKGLLAQNHTCACTDSDIVYIDTSKASDMFEKAREVASDGADQLVTRYRAENNYKTILVHEYTHILMRHVEKGIKFVRANGDKFYPIFALACDIEANRGYGIREDSDMYGIGVTDTYYPECKGVEGLMNIYRTLKKYYGDEILDNYEKMRDNLGGDDDEEEGEEEEQEQKQEQAQSEKDSKSENDSKSEEEAEGGSSGNGKSSQEQYQAKQREKAMKSTIESMEQMREQMDKLEATMTEEELNKNLEQYDEEKVMEEEAHGMGGGDEEGLYSGTPRQELDSVYRADNQKKFELALERLKGVVRGNQARTRVPTYSRQSRKSSVDGLIRKGVKNDKALAPRVLVAMDSSGSMSSTTVTPIAEAIGTLAKMLGKTKGSYICEHDSHVKNVLPLSKWEEVVKGYYPHGDNDFDEVLKKALELKVDVVLNIGDGYARMWDMDLMKQAKARNLKWIDVQVCGMVETLQRQVIDDDAARHGDNFIGREILDCKK